jgi:multidrug resistance efflux pump
MADKYYPGVLKARIIDVRFAVSGKVVKCAVRTADKVKKGQLLASLDAKIFQTELDRQLADYEKTRADFEAYGIIKGEPSDELSKYLKAQKQATLNASVKEVELAKARLDQVNLYSPCDGVVLDDSATMAGIYTTPAGSSIKIVDTDSFYFEFELSQEEIAKFSKPREAKIKLAGVDSEIKASTTPAFSNGKAFLVRIPLSDSKDLLYGLHGKVYF